MVTEFGKLVRKQRITHGLTQLDMAERIGCSPALLSAMETGKRSVTEAHLAAISAALGLDNCERDELRTAADRMATSVKIDLTAATAPQRELVAVFARRFGLMGDRMADKLRALLDGKKA